MLNVIKNNWLCKASKEKTKLEEINYSKNFLRKKNIYLLVIKLNAIKYYRY